MRDVTVVGTSLDEHDRDSFIEFAHQAVAEFGGDDGDTDGWSEFAKLLHWSPGDDRPGGPAPHDRGGRGRARPASSSGCTTSACRRRPRWRSSTSSTRRGLVERSRIIMEKPFGTDLASAQKLNAELHEVFDEEQIFRIDHFLGKEAAQNILAFRFANGLFEPIWHRNHIDHVQIDVPEDARARAARVVLREHRRLPRHGGHPPVPGAGVHRDGAARPRWSPMPISEEKNKVFRSMLPIEPHDVVRGQYVGYRDIEGVAPRLRDRDLRRPQVLRSTTGAGPACRSTCAPASGWPRAPGSSRSPSASRRARCSRPGSGVGDHGPDHLTFDLADQAKMSLSFYGKRPGPGMKLDKLSMQFAMHDTGWAGAVLEAYERLIYDAARGDRTLFTTAEGIERLWEISTPLLENPPVVRPYAQGSWGPNQIHQLIAPFTWRLPFERQWRNPNELGG